MKSKYYSRKITRDGITFDSVKEYRRFCELSLLEKAGAVTELQRQQQIILIPPQREPDTIGARGGRKPGKVIERAAIYVADFTYKENGKLVVEDVKGYRTKDYVLKRKMALYLLGIRIRET